MGLHRHLILLVVCLFGGARWAGAADGCIPPDRPVGWIVSVQGRVEVRANPAAPWRLARPDETLCSRAILQVGERSRARVALANAPLSLDQNTTLHLVGGPEPIRAAEDEPLLINLLRGALYVFSRAPHTLTVNTPFVAAGIEGTEFLVRVEERQTQVTVFEGVVTARNAHGEARVTSGESVVAEAGKAPVPVVIARPRDAVAWALHYPSVLPPLIDPKAAADLPEAVRETLLLAGRGDLAQAFARLDRVPEAERGPQFHIYRAALLLSVGRVDEARADIDRALLEDPAAGLAYALRTIIAVAQNDKTGALADARRGVELSPERAAPKIALSYAEQAHFQLEAARDALLAAVQDEPRNALAWARLAELWLMLGHRDRAREAAETAAKLAPQLERTQTVLGFAALAEFRTRAAKAAFERAIALNSADPLPRFGLGLAKIRRGNLEEGREDIEIAVGLDPNNALLRSYLGKAYFEERTTNPLTYFKELVNNFPNQENTLAAEQFAIAKDLDPLDPTPYFYDAIRKQSENRPVEALRDAERAIRLNENRAVYRSRELLDQDRAARQASLGRIYNDLGFEQLGINEATKSLTFDPASASAHRFLSDLYATQPRQEIARVSELLQAQLLQDININPVQPSLVETNLNIFARGGPARPGFNEFTPLFERNQVQLNLSGEAGNNDTLADEAVVSGLYNRFSASAGQFHYETDGFRENADIQHDIYNIFAQAALTPKLNMQAEFRSRRTEKGDTNLNFDPNFFNPGYRFQLKDTSARLGLRIDPRPSSNLIFSGIYNDRFTESVFPSTISPILSTGKAHQVGWQAEGQYIFRSRDVNIIAGFGRYDIDSDEEIQIQSIVNIPGLRQLPPLSFNVERTQGNYYIYSRISFPESLTWTIGLSYDDYKERETEETGRPLEPFHVEGFNPKVGLQWKVTDRLQLRLAAFQTIKRALAMNQTIEPTQIAGFNQFFDDINGMKSWRYGFGLDAHLADALYGGVEVSRRDLSPVGSTQDQRENVYRAYFYYLLHPEWALSGELEFDEFQGPPYVETVRVPISARYFHPTGFFAGITTTFVWQNLDREEVKRQDTFIVFDASIGYRFPRRRGIVSIEARNLLNKDFRFIDDSFRTFAVEPESVASRFIPERAIVGRLTLSF